MNIKALANLSSQILLFRDYIIIISVDNFENDTNKNTIITIFKYRNWLHSMSAPQCST